MQLGFTVGEEGEGEEVAVELVTPLLNPLTRGYIERLSFRVSGERLVAQSPAELVGLPPVPVIGMERLVDFEASMRRLFDECIFLLQRRCSELQSLGIQPRIDRNTLDLRAEIDAGDMRLEIAADKQGNFRVLTAREGERALRVPRDARFDISEFRDISGLRGYLRALIEDAQGDPLLSSSDWGAAVESMLPDPEPEVLSVTVTEVEDEPEPEPLAEPPVEAEITEVSADPDPEPDSEPQPQADPEPDARADSEAEAGADPFEVSASEELEITFETGLPDVPPVQLPAAPITLGDLARHFGENTVVAQRSTLDIVAELRVGEQPYRFAASRVAARSFRGLLAGPVGGKIWADRFELDAFPGLVELAAQTLGVSPEEVEILGVSASAED